jgi:capsular polysaccharide biosynthesis protein
MDVLSLIRLLARHWWVTVPAALLTLVGVAAAFKVSSPTYRATGSIVLLSPPEAPNVDIDPESAAGQNPYARFNDLSVMADVVSRIMANDTTHTELLKQGVTDYEVVANRFSRGPVIEVTGENESSEGAVESTKAVLEEIDAVLVQLQEQDKTADPKYFITSDPLQSPSTAAPLYGSTVRAAIAALVVGSLGTLGLAVLAETLGPRVKAWRTRPTDVAVQSLEAGQPSGSGDPSEHTERSPAEEEAEEETAMAEAEALRWTRSDNGHARRSRAGNGHSKPATERGP